MISVWFWVADQTGYIIRIGWRQAKSEGCITEILMHRFINSLSTREKGKQRVINIVPADLPDDTHAPFRLVARCVDVGESEVFIVEVTASDNTQRSHKVK